MITNTINEQTKDLSLYISTYYMLTFNPTYFVIFRQLPMLAAALCGRVHLDFTVFRSRNHLNLFTQVLGLLELLQPYLFLKEHAHGLEDTLMSYFSLFKVKFQLF